MADVPPMAPGSPDAAAPSDGSRRLKAIMFTDIKGYSAMMGADEQRTVKLVLEHRQIVRECLTKHDGTEHETIGDAFVVLFDSVVNAVRCGAEIQGRLKQRNAGLPESEQVWLRIGIHLGDIILQGDGIYGDGVNVAARVQDKADPGGISITEQVYLQIDGKVDFPIESLGKVDLKNIRNPPSLYKLRLDGSAVTPRRRTPVAALVAGGLLVLLGGVAAWWLLRPPPPAVLAVATAPAPVAPVAPVAPAAAVAPTPAPAPVPASTPAAAPDDAKVRAGRKVAEALKATGDARIELLREALVLDPDNDAVQAMLAAAVTAQSQASKPEPSRPLAPSRAVHSKPKDEPSDDATRIKRTIVVE